MAITKCEIEKLRKFLDANYLIKITLDITEHRVKSIRPNVHTGSMVFEIYGEPGELFSMDLFNHDDFTVYGVINNWPMYNAITHNEPLGWLVTEDDMILDMDDDDDDEY